MAIEYSPDSNYRNTAIIDNKYLGIYNSPVVDVADHETKNIIIENKFNNRPDLLAHSLYGNSKLWWVFAEFNPDTLKDPIIDFESGITIIVPIRFG
jgi:hypothetical protein